MNLLTGNIQAGPWIQALYHTLGHTLWQGVLLAALTAVILQSTRNSAPVRRYNLLIGAMVLFVCAAGYTFFVCLDQLQGTAMVDETVIAATGTAGAGIAYEKGSVVDSLLELLNRNGNNIVLLWCIVVSFRSLQLGLGFTAVRRLRRHSVYQAGNWQHYVTRISREMGISRLVQLAESGLTKVPLVIGHLKPMILVPAGLMASLPPAEIEAILLHELAHIRRRDYLVNILQSVAETLFFFHPAVWWLSSLIRREREHCCDVMAIDRSSNKKSYIRALLSCQEYQGNAPAFAMAFTKREDPLLERVKRILYGKHTQLGFPEKALLTLCLIFTMVTGLIACRLTGQKEDDHREAATSPAYASKTVHSDTATTAAVTNAAPASAAQPEQRRSGDVASNRIAECPATPPVAAPAPPANAAISAKPQSKEPTQVIVDDLIREGRIDPGAKSLSYKLTNDYFEVNEQRQSWEVFRRYRDKFVRLAHKSGDSWKVTYKMESD